VTRAATVVVAVPLAGSRVRAGVSSRARPVVVSVQAPDLQRKVGEPARHGWSAQLVSSQSMSPSQSSSSPSLQLASVVAPGGVGVQAAAAVQAEGVVEEQVPVPPPLIAQLRVAHPGSAVQSPAQIVASAPKVMVTESKLPPWVARTRALPAQAVSTLASQVISARLPEAP
jgi:hypothetical protein